VAAMIPMSMMTTETALLQEQQELAFCEIGQARNSLGGPNRI